MIAFSPLTSTLKVTAYKINIIDLDFIKLGELLEPAGNVIAINSNYIHKCLNGYEQFLAKPKSVESKTKRGGLRGDRSTFNACIEFTIISTLPEKDASNTFIIRYFPNSGSIQLFTHYNIINTFLHYLQNCKLPEFASVDLVDNPKIVLNNYKFNLILDSKKMINSSKLHDVLDQSASSPFRIQFIKSYPSKISILFSNKIRVHIWPRSGKVIFFRANDELSAKLIYDFLLLLFTKDDSLICDVPTS